MQRNTPVPALVRSPPTRVPVAYGAPERGGESSPAVSAPRRRGARPGCLARALAAYRRAAGSRADDGFRLIDKVA